VNAAQACGASVFQGYGDAGVRYRPSLPFLLPAAAAADCGGEMASELITLLRGGSDGRRLLRAVEEGEIDFAIIALPMDVGRLRVVPDSYGTRLWLIASEEDPMAKTAPPRKFPRVDMQRLMLLSDGPLACATTRFRLAKAGRRGRDRIPSTIEASSLPTLVADGWRRGLGVSLLARDGQSRPGSWVGKRRTVIARPPGASGPHKREIVLVARPTTPRGGIAGPQFSNWRSPIGNSRRVHGPKSAIESSVSLG